MGSTSDGAFRGNDGKGPAGEPTNRTLIDEDSVGIFSRTGGDHLRRHRLERQLMLNSSRFSEPSRFAGLFGQSLDLCDSAVTSWACSSRIFQRWPYVV